MAAKSFFIFFVISFIFVELSGKPLMSPSEDLNIILACNSTYPVNRRTLNVALIEKHLENYADERFRCFLHCLYWSYSWMDVGGAFQHDVMRNSLRDTNLDDPSIEYLLATCTNTEAEDKCDRAYFFTECFWAETEKLAQSFSPDEGS